MRRPWFFAGGKNIEKQAAFPVPETKHFNKLSSSHLAIVSAVLGTFSYEVQDTDLSATGLYEAQVDIVFSDGRKLSMNASSPNIICFILSRWNSFLYKYG